MLLVRFLLFSTDKPQNLPLFLKGSSKSGDAVHERHIPRQKKRPVQSTGQVNRGLVSQRERLDVVIHGGLHVVAVLHRGVELAQHAACERMLRFLCRGADARGGHLFRAP